MRTTFRARQPYEQNFLACAKAFVNNSPVRPEHFIEIMHSNMGSVGVLTGAGPDEGGLEHRNPLIVALGDSVTAGHFEGLFPSDPQEMAVFMQEAAKVYQTGDWENADFVKKYLWEIPGHDLKKYLPPIEVTDARESYVEKFRNKLIDKYQLTTPSVINAGIAGDTLISMEKRLERDVLRHDPDLVLINGSLNWDGTLGTTEEYKELLRGMVKKIKSATKADIILLTPNGDLKNTMMEPDAPEPTTPERAEAIRELAAEEQVCLADVRAVWDEAREQGIPWKELLANGINHPDVTGHEVYAIVLMKLFEE